jgi:hypothetical protein
MINNGVQYFLPTEWVEESITHNRQQQRNDIIVHGIMLIYALHAMAPHIIEHEAMKDIRKTDPLVDQRKEDLAVPMLRIAPVLVGRPETKEANGITVLRLRLLQSNQKIDRGLVRGRLLKIKVLLDAPSLPGNHYTLLVAIHHHSLHNHQEDDGDNIQGQ